MPRDLACHKLIISISHRIARAPIHARMNFSTHKTTSGVFLAIRLVYLQDRFIPNQGFLLPSIHSAPPFFTSVPLLSTRLPPSRLIPSLCRPSLKPPSATASNRTRPRKPRSRSSGRGCSSLTRGTAACSYCGSRTRRQPVVASGTRFCGIRGSIVGLVSLSLLFLFYSFVDRGIRIGMTTVCREIEVHIPN